MPLRGAAVGEHRRPSGGEPEQASRDSRAARISDGDRVPPRVLVATALPGVVEGVAFAGTPLESRTYRVNKKSFLFVSETLARFKLDASCSEAKRLGCEVGANSWVKLSLDAMPPASVVRRWTAESHTLAGGGLNRTGASARPAASRRSRK